ncbi:hypothetical protein KI387_015872, partial [Taxus chinensis]
DIGMEGKGESGMVEARFRTLGGDTITVEIWGDQTVKDLKTTLLLHHCNSMSNFHLFLRGSKLDVSAQMSSLMLQENEFIVLIPFTKKQRPNSISISGMNLKLDITEKDYKQSVNSESCDRLQSCCKGNISRESICESSGNHSLAIADNAWHDIISDIALLNTSSNILHDEQSSASAKSVLGKRN